MKHKVKHLHFVGIGGSGMSGIAELMFNLNYRVSGSDVIDGLATQRLRKIGVEVFIGHDKEHIAGADAVVISSAVNKKNPEIIAARCAGVPVVPRALMLVELMRLRQGIAVAGTHGKTTTTSLIASILAEAKLDPTFVIGGRLSAAGENAKLGTGEFIVVEADESDASFLFLQPVLAVITNIDADHMSTYENNFEKLEQAFYELIQRLPFYGVAILCGDDPAISKLIPKINKSYITYGLEETCDLRAIEIKEAGTSMFFKVRIKQSVNYDSKEFSVILNLVGKHNVLNALAAIAVSLEVGANIPAIVKALENFQGVNRRFEIYGDIIFNSSEKFLLIDDYGHHPRELEATLDATRGAFPGRRIILVFQPHRYSRTRDCFEDFVRVLSSSDVLVITEVYSAGEKPIAAADGRALTRAIRLSGTLEPLFIEKLDEVVKTVLSLVKANDIVLTMGAGSISKLPKLIREVPFE